MEAAVEDTAEVEEAGMAEMLEAVEAVGMEEMLEAVVVVGTQVQAADTTINFCYTENG